MQFRHKYTKSKSYAISKFSFKKLTKGIFNPKTFNAGYTKLKKKHHQNQEKPEIIIN